MAHWVNAREDAIRKAALQNQENEGAQALLREKQDIANQQGTVRNAALAKLLGASTPEEQQAAQGVDTDNVGPVADAGQYGKQLNAIQTNAKPTLQSLLKGRSVQLDEGGGASQVGPDVENMLALQRAKLQQAQDAPSAGQKAVDQAFGKDYADYQASGGYSGAQKNLNTMKGIEQELQQPGAQDWWDRATANLPNSIRATVSPTALARQDHVKSVVIKSLKQDFGGRITNQEMSNAVDAAYNPKLSAKENLPRIRATIQDMATRADEKQRSGQYFEQHKGTLQGLGTATGRGAQRQAPQTPSLSPEDQDAHDWAQANPQDPRAQAILQKLGL